MGMYDDVYGVTIECPFCKKPVSDWQSKDGDCILGRIHFTEVGRFYTSCSCGAWLEFTRKTAMPIEQFQFEASGKANQDKPVPMAYVIIKTEPAPCPHCKRDFGIEEGREDAKLREAPDRAEDMGL